MDMRADTIMPRVWVGPMSVGERLMSAGASLVSVGRVR